MKRLLVRCEVLVEVHEEDNGEYEGDEDLDDIQIAARDRNWEAVWVHDAIAEAIREGQFLEITETQANQIESYLEWL